VTVRDADYTARWNADLYRDSREGRRGVYSGQDVMAARKPDPSNNAVAALLDSIGSELIPHKKVWDDGERNSAPRFRPFSFFSKREEAASRVIAALLDPEGHHGQGNAFLRQLTNLIDHKQLSEQADGAVSSVDVEDPTNENRRIDIVVRFASGFTLGIENKVFGAAEQENQIADYLKELEERGPFVLLFLHSGALSQKQQEITCNEKRLVPKPAQQFLLEWLAACSKEDVCKAGHVHAFLNNFAHYIKRPPEVSFMTSKDAQNVVTSKITQSIDTLDAAIAVRDNFDNATQQLATAFVNRLYEKLEGRVAKIRRNGFQISMSRYRYVGQDDGTIAITHKSALFTEGFGDDEWKYVGFRIGDIVAVELEIGSPTRKPGEGFGERCEAIIGIHKAGLWKAPAWTLTSTLSDVEGNRLKDKVDEAGLRMPEIIKVTASKPSTDWHWFRSFRHPPLPLYDSEVVRSLYLMTHDPSNRVIDDLADLMIGLGNVCTEFLKTSARRPK
jgi:PD-(D/E)XK nuclease superfamily